MDSRTRGSVSAMVAVFFVPLTMVLAVVVDLGRTFADRRALQNGVEASALAVASDWAESGAMCAASSTALVPANVDGVPAVECSVLATSSGATARVAAESTVDLLFASLLGRDHATIEASTGAMVAPAASVSGLRPIALCSDNPQLQAWIAGGMTSNIVVDVYFEDSAAGCGGDVPGNWAVLDFDGGSNSMADAQEWIDNGFPGSVSVGESLFGDPGIPSPALGVDGIVGREVLMTVFTNARDGGAGALYDVVGFVSVQIESATLNGSSSSRHLSVRFKKAVVRGVPGGGAQPGFGTVSVAVCSFDGQGVCP